jgi:hypothetical protein
MINPSSWGREWTVRDAFGEGCQHIMREAGAEWSFKLEDDSDFQYSRFRLVVTDGTPPDGWGNFRLSVQGWTVFNWGAARLEAWRPDLRDKYVDEISRHFATTMSDIHHFALRLEGPLDPKHIVKLIWIPNVVDHSVDDLLLIRVIPMSGGMLQSGSGHSDPR